MIQNRPNFVPDRRWPVSVQPSRDFSTILRGWDLLLAAFQVRISMNVLESEARQKQGGLL